MAHLVDLSILDPFLFVGADGALVAGKDNTDFTKTVYLTTDDGVTVASSVIESVDLPGRYRLWFIPSLAGVWAAEVSCLHDGITYRWAETFEVVDADADDPWLVDPSSYAAGTVGYQINALFKRPVRAGNG